MNTLMIFFTAIVLVNLGLTLMLVRYTNKSLVRIIGVLLFIALIPGSYLSYDFLLSKPRPILSSFLQSTGDVKLLKHKSVKDEAIYLWILEKGKTEPAYVALPYSNNLAKKLDQATQKAKQAGGYVTLKNLNKMAKGAKDDKIKNKNIANSGKSFGEFDVKIVRNPDKPEPSDVPMRLLQKEALDANKPGARRFPQGAPLGADPQVRQQGPAQRPPSTRGQTPDPQYGPSTPPRIIFGSPYGGGRPPGPGGSP